MKATKKLSELTDLTPLQNPQEVKGGFFFLLSYLFYKPAYKAPEYHAPAPEYHAPAKDNHYSEKKSKKGY